MFLVFLRVGCHGWQIIYCCHEIRHPVTKILQRITELLTQTLYGGETLLPFLKLVTESLPALADHRHLLGDVSCIFRVGDTLVMDSVTRLDELVVQWFLASHLFLQHLNTYNVC